MKAIEKLKFGQIRYVQLDPEFAKQGGTRPAIVIQNNIGCEYSPRVWVIPLTSRVEKAKEKHLPMHVFVKKTETNGLKTDSIAVTEQAQFVLKSNISKNTVGVADPKVLRACGKAFADNCPIFENNAEAAV